MCARPDLSLPKFRKTKSVQVQIIGWPLDVRPGDANAPNQR